MAHYTPIQFGAAATSQNLNAPLEQLDRAIGANENELSVQSNRIDTLENRLDNTDSALQHER